MSTHYVVMFAYGSQPSDVKQIAHSEDEAILYCIEHAMAHYDRIVGSTVEVWDFENDIGEKNNYSISVCWKENFACWEVREI